VGDRRFQLRGGNARAFGVRSSGEMVLSGPAGTGKTLTNLLHLLWYGETYPTARMLILRKTRASLTESALVTWEQNVLGDGHPIIGTPINRGNRHSYRFPNGSVLVTGGMDRPDKILSTEWDLIYVPEATDLELLDWETLGGRLRAGAGPYDLIFGDCNPTTPTHWIFKRAQDGALQLIPTTHRDNPRYWDKQAQDWTEAGKRYVVERLERLTGPRRKRFLEGVWAAAEGMVYDGYDAEVHLHPKGWEPPKEWRRVWGADWGFVQPTAIPFFAIDGDNRMHLYREIYKTRTRVEEIAKECAKLVESGEEPYPEVILADHDPECIATFQAHGKVKRGEQMASLPIRAADKRDRDKGIQLVQGLFDKAGDGKPRIMFRPDARRHAADPHLKSEGKPLSLLEELTGYTWKVPKPDQAKDEPIEFNDHAMDAMRYVAVHTQNRRQYWA